MSGPQKTYVIEPSKRKPRVDVDLPPGDGTSQGTAGNDGTSSALRSADRRPGWPLLLLYCTGPFAIFATSRGRRSRPWAIAAVLSVLIGLVTLWRWEAVVSATFAGSREAVAFLLAACVAAVGMTAVWARGVFLIGRQEGARVRRIPEFLKRPAGSGILGAAMPGLGLMISGRSRQAAAVLWMVCLALVSILILSQADWLWRFNRQAGALAAAPRTLEYLFIGLAVCALLGAVSWVVQALEGMRRATKGNGHAAAMRTGAAIAVLCVAVAVAGLSLEGRTFAASLDSAAQAMSGEGFEIAPILMAEAAMRLDSSRPAYTAHAIAIYESAGKGGRADLLRRSLVQRLAPCIGVLEEQGLVTRAQAGDQPAPSRAQKEPFPAELLLPAELLIGPQAQSPFGP
ncbi:MAG: hypothetical protein PHQ19_02415 [Candidatus Krumholzibacteria bacterium]|nr:hypothetical protein [Candidatus Krumholzibacteria bacterium]